MKRLLFIILWTVGLIPVAFILFMGLGVLLGLAGAASWKLTTLELIGRMLAFGITGIPLTGMLLGILGILPGTKRKSVGNQ